MWPSELLMEITFKVASLIKKWEKVNDMYSYAINVEFAVMIFWSIHFNLELTDGYFNTKVVEKMVYQYAQCKGSIICKRSIAVTEPWWG